MEDAPQIFATAGISNFHYQILLNAGNTTFAAICSTSALYTLDHIGRRKTLGTALGIMIILWLIIGLLLKFYPATSTAATVPHAFIVLFIWLFYATYASSWGPAGWWLPMEVLPLNLRARGSSISTMISLCYSLCVVKTSPLLFASIGYKTYFYYMGEYAI